MIGVLIKNPLLHPAVGREFVRLSWRHYEPYGNPGSWSRANRCLSCSLGERSINPPSLSDVRSTYVSVAAMLTYRLWTYRCAGGAGGTQKLVARGVVVSRNGAVHLGGNVSIYGFAKSSTYCRCFGCEDSRGSPPAGGCEKSTLAWKWGGREARVC